MSGLRSEENPDKRISALSFREYRKTDLERCVKITAEAWPELVPGGLDVATMEWYGWPATWKIVACDSDSAVGLLFGRINSEVGALGRIRTSFGHATVYLKMLLGLYGKTPNKLASLRGGMAGDKDIAKNSPEVDGEITYLVVDSRYRGMGIGKELVRRFAEHAKEEGAKDISVYTTVPGSDLRFYEGYGFTRHGNSFRDGFMSVIRNEDVKAMFYVLDIGTATAAPHNGDGEKRVPR